MATICSGIIIQNVISLSINQVKDKRNIISVMNNFFELKTQSKEAKYTGTAQKGIVFPFKGYLRSVIIPSPTKR